MNTKLHAICDSQGRLLNLFLTTGQVNDCTGVRALVGRLPKVKWLHGDHRYDANWFREALQVGGICACIQVGKLRNKTVKYHMRRFKCRNRIEIVFGSLKDWQREVTRSDRRPKVILSAIAPAAMVIYW